MAGILTFCPYTTISCIDFAEEVNAILLIFPQVGYASFRLCGGTNAPTSIGHGIRILWARSQYLGTDHATF